MGERFTQDGDLAAQIAEAVVYDTEYGALVDFYAGRMRPDVEEEFDESLMRLIVKAVGGLTERIEVKNNMASMEAFNEGVSEGFDIGYDTGRAAAEAEFNGRTE